jgi:hypothetical protein
LGWLLRQNSKFDITAECHLFGVTALIPQVSWRRLEKNNNSTKTFHTQLSAIGFQRFQREN